MIGISESHTNRCEQNINTRSSIWNSNLVLMSLMNDDMTQQEHLFQNLGNEIKAKTERYLSSQVVPSNV